MLAHPGPPATAGIGFQLGWILFQLTTWATILAFIRPKLLGVVGMDGAGTWLEHHLWVRILASPVLMILGALSAFTPMGGSGRGTVDESLAAELGATLTDTPGIDRTHGISRGPGLRVPVGRSSMEVNFWQRRSRITTVASARVTTASELGFVAHGASRDPVALRGLQQFVVAGALERAAEHSDDPRAAQVARTLDYLGRPPIETGRPGLDRAMVVRSNQPDAARRLFASDLVASAVDALNERTTRWEWACHPAATSGARDVTIECPVALDDVDSLRLLRTLMGASLDFLAGQDRIAA